MRFADTLKHFRRERGLSQPGLADASGVPVGTIRDYEQGKRGPLLENAAKLAVALGVSLDALAGLADGEAKPRGRRKAK